MGWCNGNTKYSKINGCIAQVEVCCIATNPSEVRAKPAWLNKEVKMKSVQEGFSKN